MPDSLTSPELPSRTLLKEDLYSVFIKEKSNVVRDSNKEERLLLKKRKTANEAANLHTIFGDAEPTSVHIGNPWITQRLHSKPMGLRRHSGRGLTLSKTRPIVDAVH